MSNPLMRGGLVIGGGILAGNALGFVRSAVTAYLLGTHSLADSLAVALGPVDMLNGVSINTMVFAFVPVLTGRHGSDRATLLRRTLRLFTWVFCTVCLAIEFFAPWLIHVLGPGLAPRVIPEAIAILRISALSVPFVGGAGIYSALLYTERRFAPSAFYQAVLNLLVVSGALALWPRLGIYGFAIGYLTGAMAQFVLVWSFARRSLTQLFALQLERRIVDEHTTADLLSKPAWFLLYALLLSSNLIVTRAYATQAGAGMAAAFDYSIRCVNVLVAYLVSPVSNSLLPEIARLRNEDRGRDAIRLIIKTLGFTAAGAVIACVVGMVVREPVIALLFQRGNFTRESTLLVAGVFLGFAPSMIGTVLLEIASRSLFALDRPMLPVLAMAAPVTCNLMVCMLLRPHTPYQIGIGSSIGLFMGFALLFLLLLARRKQWMREFHSKFEAA